MESLNLENIIKKVGLPLTENQGLALCYKSAKHVLVYFNEIQRAGISYVPTVSETNFTTDGEVLQLCTKTGIQTNAVKSSAPVVIRTVNPTGPLASVSPRKHTINEPYIASTAPIISSTVNKVPVLQRSQKQLQQHQKATETPCKPSQMLTSLGLPLPVTSGAGQSLSTGPDRTTSGLTSSAPVQHPSQDATPDISGKTVETSIRQASLTSSVPGRRCISTRIGVFDQPLKLPDGMRGMTVRERSAILEDIINQPISHETGAKALDRKPPPHQNDHPTGKVNGEDDENRKISIKQRAAMFESEGPIPLPRLIVPVKGGKALSEAELVGSLAKMIWPLVYISPQDVNNNHSVLKKLLQLMSGRKVFRPTLQQILAECREDVEGDADKFYANILKDYITQYLKLASLLNYGKPNMPETAELDGANITSRPSSNILMRMVAAGDTASAKQLSPKPDRFISDAKSAIPNHINSATTYAEHSMAKPKCAESEQLDTISCHNESEKLGIAMHVEADKVDTIQRLESERGSSIASVATSDEFELDTTSYESLDETNNTQRLASQRVENIAGLDTEKMVKNTFVESVKMDSTLCPSSNTLVRMVGTDTSLATKAILPESDVKIWNVSSDNQTPITANVENSFKSRSEEIRVDPILSLQCKNKGNIPCRDLEATSGTAESKISPGTEPETNKVEGVTSGPNTESLSGKGKLGNISDVLRSLTNIQDLRKTLDSLADEFLDALKTTAQQGETTADPSARNESDHQDVDNIAPEGNTSKTQDFTSFKESDTILEKIESVISGSDSTEMKHQKVLSSVGTQIDCRVEIQCTDEELHQIEDTEVNTTKLRSNAVRKDDQSLRTAIKIVEGSSDSDSTEDEGLPSAKTAVSGSIGNVRDIPNVSDIRDVLGEDFSELKATQAAYEDGILHDGKHRDVMRAEIASFVQEDLDMIRSRGALGYLYHRGAPSCGEQCFAHSEEERWKAESFHSLSPGSGDDNMSDLDEMVEELRSLPSTSAASLGSVASGTSSLCSLPSDSPLQLTAAAVMDKCFMFTRLVINEAASKLNISALAETLGVSTNRSQDNGQHQKPYRVTSFVRSVVKQAASYLTIPNWAKNVGVEIGVNQDLKEALTNSAATAIWYYQKVADFIKKSSITLRDTMAPYAHIIGVTTIGFLSLSHLMAPDALLDISMLYLTLITRPSMRNLLLFQVIKLAVGLYYFPQFQNYLQY